MGGLEDHVLDYASAHEQKISVFTGPVLADDDVVYRGIRIPRRFWKIAAWIAVDGTAAPELRSAGFLLDQGPSLDAIDLGLRDVAGGETPPPLGPFLTFQVPVSDIGAITGLDVDLLADADRYDVVATGRAAERWNLLTDSGQIRL